ncbi:MAG: YafY family transcriptional regulator [Motiliproteus sp.]|nr:YafY family transcriptional regulator [Motiliproteus sp.]MCW9051652.1 YafY family transcriptional regulator [Motiliproteus sp.]
MRKAERLFQLITLLRSRRQVMTAQELAERLEVSERTIYRDMQALSLSGMPIESEAGVGYRLRPGFNIPPIMFDENELEALLLGVRMVQGWSDDQLSQAAATALDKIRSVLPEQLHHRHTLKPEWLLVPDFHRTNRTQYSSRIREAIKTQQMLDLHYQREDSTYSQRRVWPLGLVYWGQTWTLVAWCEIRHDYRMFRLDRIQELEESDCHYPLHPQRNLQHYLSRFDCDS